MPKIKSHISLKSSNIKLSTLMLQLYIPIWNINEILMELPDQHIKTFLCTLKGIQICPLENLQCIPWHARTIVKCAGDMRQMIRALNWNGERQRCWLTPEKYWLYMQAAQCLVAVRNSTQILEMLLTRNSFYRFATMSRFITLYCTLDHCV